MTRGGLPYGTYSANSTYSADRTDRTKGIMGLRWGAYCEKSCGGGNDNTEISALWRAPPPPLWPVSVDPGMCVSIVGRFQVWFGRQTITSRLLVKMNAGLASMRDKSRAVLAMDSRSCPSIVRVHYLVQLRHLCIWSLRAGILFLRVHLEMHSIDNQLSLSLSLPL